MKESHRVGLERLKAIRRATAESKKKTAEAKDKKAKKRAVRGRRPNEDKAPLKRKTRRKVNSKDVEKWFREGLWELFGKKYLISPWGPHQRKLALNLLDIYGEELTQKAVKRLCSSWDKLVAGSNGRLEGQPTINLLWGMRERIFGEVQNEGRTSTATPAGKNSDEYRETGEDSPTIGW